jgi:uncharacterized phosphosugar-binding protein
MSPALQEKPPSELGPLLVDLVNTVATSETTAIERAAQLCARAATTGGRVFAFGAGHAYAFAAELHSRAGGLELFRAMNLDDLRTTPRLRSAELSDSAPERCAPNGPRLLQRHGVRHEDVLIIASQSGRNAAAVEMAIAAHKGGMPIIAVSSVQHATGTASRHHSGHNLVDVADIVIDNHCPVGDAMIEVGEQQSICAGSTVSFATIAQLLNEATYRQLRSLGVEVRIIRSANLDDDPPAHG